jgi:uncharacterized protein
MKNFIKRYELPSFFLLAYLLSWLSVPFLQGGITPQGVAIAARIVIGVTLGAQGVREYRKRLTNWRAGWWYLIAPLIVIGYEGIAFILNVISGAKLVELPHLSIGMFMMLVLFGGQWEELGWTGYALPRLRERFAAHPNGSLMAVLVLGVFRMLWHLPLFLYGKMYWFDILIFTFAFQIIIAWIYDRSGKSVPAVMAFHFTSNILGAFFSPVFSGMERLMFQASFMSLAAFIALVIVLASQIKVRQKEVEAI